MSVLENLLSVAAINAYGVLALGGFLSFAALVWLLPVRGYQLTARQFIWLMMLMIWAVLVGGRLANSFFYHYLAGDEASFYYLVWNRGGLSFHGSVGAGIAATYGFAQATRLPFFWLADRLLTAAPIILILGRIGNYLNGEIPGLPTSWFTAAPFSAVAQWTSHPVTLYEAFGYAVLFLGLLLLVHQSAAVLGTGLPFSYFLVGYSLVRIPLEFLKAEPYLLAGVNTGIWLTLPFLASGLIIYLAIRLKIFISSRTKKT